jgi:hypothetical protein
MKPHMWFVVLFSLKTGLSMPVEGVTENGSRDMEIQGPTARDLDKRVVVDYYNLAISAACVGFYKYPHHRAGG